MEDNKLTLFYLKDTGEIKYFCTGEQDMNYFGSYKEEKSKTIDFIIILHNKDVVTNKNNFYINTDKILTWRGN